MARAQVAAYSKRQLTVEPERFRRGDANGDGVLQLTDAVFTLLYLYRGGIPASCMKALDSNDDGNLNSVDALFTLKHLFDGGGPLPLPTGECGPDPTVDGLSCERMPACP